MKKSERDFLVQELVKDLEENPEDIDHIINGVKEGYPDEYVSILTNVAYVLQDKALMRNPDLQRGLQVMREGKTVRL